MSAGIEDQIRAVADAAFDQTSAVERNRYVRASRSSHRRWWLAAAASVLVVALIGAIALIDRSDSPTTPADIVGPIDDDASGPEVADPLSATTVAPAPTTTVDVDTEPSVTPSQRAVEPVLPDPSRLRYQDPLPDDAVAFVDDDSLRPPEVVELPSVPGPEPGDDAPARQAWFVLMDGAEVEATGAIFEITDDWNPSQFSGEPVDIGVAGAVFVDDTEAAIAWPVNGSPRIVAAAAFLLTGRSDPEVSTAELTAVARAVGSSDDWSTVELEEQGVFVFEMLSAVGVPAEGLPFTIVEHGRGLRVVLQRFDEPLTEQRFLAFAADTLRQAGGALPADAALGDTAIDPDVGYIELLSPVDVVVVTFNRPGLGSLIDIAAADDLDTAFDGTISAPPKPGR